MRQWLLTGISCSVAGLLLLARVPVKDVVRDHPERQVMGCGPGTLQLPVADAAGRFIRPLPGWGSHSYQIKTSSDSAQHFFNQGLTLYYGYHPKEALASFKEAARFDPQAPMPYWGQLLAMGPTYNQAHLYILPPGLDSVMAAIPGGAAGRESDLLEATKTRVNTARDSAAVDAGNRAYAGAMRTLLNKYPDDPEIAMLYVDAVMLIHPWDFWFNSGEPKPWTKELVTITERVLRSSPGHPGSLHYHIHLTEASRQPEVAYDRAESLKRLFPGIAHLVHMSSHEYERNGRFALGVPVNDLADQALKTYDSLAPHLSLSRQLPHYFAVQAYSALSGAMMAETKRSALRVRQSVTPVTSDNYSQYLYTSPMLAHVRLGHWERILGSPVISDTSLVYARILEQFTRGMALIHSKRMKDAAATLGTIHRLLAESSLKKRRIPFNNAFDGASIAALILEGCLQYAGGHIDEGATLLQQAAAIEDRMIYSEPRDWMLPARQYLGVMLLEQGRAKEAETVYREDLIWNPGNGWALTGLIQSLRDQGKTREMPRLEKGYQSSFSGAERPPLRSAFLPSES